MAVAWIGNREVTGEQAARRAAELLVASSCPVFSLNGDVHAWRAAIMLAERVGAAYDQLDGGVLARELALFTGKGAITVAPGEMRRRADCIVIVGELPAVSRGWMKELVASPPDLSGGGKRDVFRVGTGLGSGKEIAAGDGAAQTLAALRAQLSGRVSAVPVKNIEAFRKALEKAAYTAFVYSGAGLDELGIEMLQGVVADINKTKRAAMVLLPASDDAWGGALVSTWMTGFAPRTGFGRGMPEYDPWRFDVARMIADGEADLHLVMSAGKQALALPRKMNAIAIAHTDKPVTHAAVTIRIGAAGVDHEAVRYSSRTGTLVLVEAAKPSSHLSAMSAIRLIAEALPC
ncbi:MULTISPECIES: tungsten formylmethanofuran dehydrogenase [Mesorhizobium]|uniref:Tungsten formylmethanofuran dehydrogenase n=1 Tax=Mesorhizobium denitrificans TaxID=2294114 RepID=A0A371XC49_9HYPH|nr:MULTISPECIES: tungsten formylmethanofuran dehydrogenase [Mesorhizobium]RFC66806.1 tungsten formylmethanofuran dehydrogenase [Mesorhizobium denitrificans]